MNYELIESIKEDLIGKLKPTRYEHTIGVAYTAASLAMRYGEDIDKVFLAGLLHDCAKGLSGEQLVEVCDNKGIYITDYERKNTALLHSKVGAYFAKELYHVEDEDILHAITYHTTGCIDMSVMDKIIYVADYIEPNRKKIPNLDRIRELAFIDLDRCILAACEGTIRYVTDICGEVDEYTLAVYEDLKKKVNE